MRLDQSASVQKTPKATGKMRGGAKHQKQLKTAKKTIKTQLFVVE